MKTELKHSGEIDVTESAKKLGFKMRVVLSRRLWDFIEGPPDACRDEAETLERLDRLLKTARRELNPDFRGQENNQSSDDCRGQR
jgi:hypothetical protein